MESCYSIYRRVSVYLLTLFVHFSFAQKIILIESPDRVFKGDEFSVRITLLTEQDDTVKLAVITDKVVDLESAFALSDSLYNVNVQSSLMALKSGARMKFELIDTLFPQIKFRTFILTFVPKRRGQLWIKFVPLKLSKGKFLSSGDESIIELEAIEGGEVTAGNCGVFYDGSYIYFSLKGVENFKDGFTLSFWLRTISLNASILSMQSGDGSLSISILNGTPVIMMDNSMGSYEIRSSKFISDGWWHNFVIVGDYSGSSLRIYVDGVSVDDVFIPGLKEFQVSDPVVRVGGLDGFMDELALWNEARSEKFVRYLSHYFVHVHDSALVFVIKFDGDERPGYYGMIEEFKFSELKLAPSTAPIFSPGIRISCEVAGEGIKVNWKVDDVHLVDEFILERKIGDEGYVQIYSVKASDSKSYSFFDSNLPDAHVCYYRVKRINKDGTYEYSDEIKIGIGLKKDFEIRGNFPNPFNNSTRIIYYLFNDTHVRLTVYDLVGREIAVLVDEFQTAGQHEIEFNLSQIENAENIPSGIYLYKLQTEKSSEVRKMIIIK
jgi:hypothetical protein